MDRLDEIVRAVTRAVHERLGGAAPEVVEVVTREVLAALPDGGTAVVAARGGGTPAVSNGDGTATTGLGSVVAWPEHALPLSTCATCVEQQRRAGPGNRAVVTATGPNRRGVIARLSECIAQAGGDIQDLSQTIVSEFFTLIIIIDLQQLALSFAELKQQLQAAAEDLGIHAVVMHEDVLRALQRV